MVDTKFFKPVAAIITGGSLTTSVTVVTDDTAAPAAPIALFVAAVHRTTLPTYTSGDGGILHLDNRGRLLVSIGESSLTADVETDQDPAPVAPIGTFVVMKFESTLPTYTAGDAVTLHSDNRGRLLVSMGEGVLSADVETDQDPAPATPIGSFVVTKFESTLPTYVAGDAATLHSGSRGRLFVTTVDPVSGNTADVGTDDSAGPANPVGTFSMALYRTALPTYTAGDVANLHVEEDGRLRVNQATVISTTALRAAAILTNAFVDSSSIATDNENQLVLLVDATLGSLASIEIRVEFSDDDATWYQETFGLISGTTDSLNLGEHAITVDGLYRIPIPLMDNFVRVGAQGTGTVTGSSLTIDGVIGVV